VAPRPDVTPPGFSTGGAPHAPPQFLGRGRIFPGEIPGPPAPCSFPLPAQSPKRLLGKKTFVLGAMFFVFPAPPPHTLPPASPGAHRAAPPRPPQAAREPQTGRGCLSPLGVRPPEKKTPKRSQNVPPPIFFFFFFRPRVPQSGEPRPTISLTVPKTKNVWGRIAIIPKRSLPMCQYGPRRRPNESRTLAF